MQLLNLNGGTGEYNSNRTSPRKVATRVQGLVPINIDPSFEFYLGIRNPQTKKYDGERLFYDKETTELEPCSATQAHDNNQLWRFQRAPEYPKGVHAIVAVLAQARFTSELKEDEDGEIFVSLDFTDVHDQDAQSSSTQLYQDQLFQIFVDQESDTKDIVIKMYNPQVESDEERFLCVDLPEKAVDFLSPLEYPPSRFVLNIPACQIKASSMEILSIQRTNKDLTCKYETLRNSTDKN